MNAVDEFSTFNLENAIVIDFRVYVVIIVMIVIFIMLLHTTPKTPKLSFTQTHLLIHFQAMNGFLVFGIKAKTKIMILNIEQWQLPPLESNDTSRMSINFTSRSSSSNGSNSGTSRKQQVVSRS